MKCRKPKQTQKRRPSGGQPIRYRAVPTPAHSHAHPQIIQGSIGRISLLSDSSLHVEKHQEEPLPFSTMWR